MDSRQSSTRNLIGGVFATGCRNAAHRAHSFRRCRLIGSQTGRNDSGTDPFGPNRNEFLITLKPYDTWPSGVSKADLIDQLRKKLSEQIPGVALNFTQPIIDTVTESVTGSSADLAVIISGPDLGQLRELARHDA